MAIAEPEMVALPPKLFVLVAQKRSGILYIRTDKNESARIALDKGKIVYCCFRHWHGYEALEPLKKIKQCSLRFSEEVLPDLSDKKDQLPPSEEVLKLLTGEAPLAISVELEGYLSIFKERLLDIMGPMAERLWEKYQTELADVHNSEQLRTVLWHIAREIPFAQERENFMSLVDQKLR
jgi:hypothetical protein